MATYFLLHYFLDGWQEWKSIPLQEGAFTIGRMSGNQLVIPDPRLSRYHARLQVADQQIWLMDLGSSSGVLLDQVPIPPNQWTILPIGSIAALGPLSICIHAVPVQPAVAPAPVAPSATIQQPEPAQPSSRQSKRGVMMVVLVMALCLCLAAAGVGAWQLYPRLADLLPGHSPEAVPSAATGDSPQLTEKSLSMAPLTVQSTHNVPASACSFSDEYGVNLSVSPETFPVEDSLTIQTASLSQEMQDELAETYHLDSLTYSVIATTLDGAGRAALQLPAPSPDSRLAVLVDDQFLALLPGAPENGVLSVNPFLGAPGAVDGYPTLAEATLPNRYFVVTPKESASAPPSGHVYLARLAEDPDVESCIPSIWHGNRCRTNQAGSVFVLYWNTEMPASLGGGDHLQAQETIDNLIKNVTRIMSAYQQAGFTNAAISKSNPVYLIISANESEPNYSQKTGNIYLGWSIVSQLAGGDGQCTLAHELFHWIQDDAYVMNAAALVNDRAWWLEMGAENGSFMIDSACIANNLATYGVAEVGGQLAWQATPFHWDWGEGARYVHALQMYISICDEGSNCAITPAEFASLVNAGSYPSSYARDNYYRNASDMALYLLGSKPVFARSSAFIPQNLRTGQGYGDYIWLKAVKGSEIDTSLAETRMRKTAPYEVTVETNIAHGGVYPLWVSNGQGTPFGGSNGYTALPGLLTVSPGPELWYSVDNGIPEFLDGSTELVLGPISDKLGVGLIRLAAAAPDGDQTFKAVVKPLDLSGDWASLLSDTNITYSNCPDNDDPMDAIDLAGFLSGYGTFVPDPAVSDGSHYVWEGSLPEDAGEGTYIDADISVEPEKITLNYFIEIPKPDTSSLLLALLGKGSPGILPARLTAMPNPAQSFALPGFLALTVLCAAGLWSWHRLPQGFSPRWLQPRGFTRALARGIPLALVMLVAGMWLSGCFGIAFWGTFSGTYTFTRVEIASVENLPAEAAEMPGIKWVLSGDGLINYDFHTLLVTEDQDGNETSTEEVCTMEYATKLKTLVGPPDMVTSQETE